MSLQQLREKIVNEIPISELIQRYGIHLTRKSTGHVGVCPFHQDSNPSMSVSDDKRIYKCFACDPIPADDLDKYSGREPQGDKKDEQ